MLDFTNTFSSFNLVTMCFMNDQLFPELPPSYFSVLCHTNLYNRLNNLRMRFSDSSHKLKNFFRQFGNSLINIFFCFLLEVTAQRDEKNRKKRLTASLWLWWLLSQISNLFTQKEDIISSQQLRRREWTVMGQSADTESTSAYVYEISTLKKCVFLYFQCNHYSIGSLNSLVGKKTKCVEQKRKYCCSVSVSVYFH